MWIDLPMQSPAVINKMDLVDNETLFESGVSEEVKAKDAMGIELYSLWFTGGDTKVQTSLGPKHAVQVEESDPPSFAMDGIAVAAQPKVFKCAQARR